MAEPNFFIIGAQKCGTTALHHAMSQHPEIFLSRKKEPFFFAMDGKVPNCWTVSKMNFKWLVYKWDDYLRLFEGVKNEKAIGEASAIYLSSYYPERTAARIRKRIPHARIIALIRQPSERAYSAFNYYHARNLEPLSDFEMALSCEKERIEQDGIPDIRHFSNGLYYKNLKPYFDFFPRNQIRVYLFEDWLNNSGAVLEDAFHFLGVDETVKVTVQQLNVGHGFRSRLLRKILLRPNLQPSRFGRLLGLFPGHINDRMTKWNRMALPGLCPHLRQLLNIRYRDDLTKLQTLIERDLSAWISPLFIDN